MGVAANYLQAHLSEVQVFCSLAFLFLGTVILMQPRDDGYDFEKRLPLLAWSALAAGMQELILGTGLGAELSLFAAWIPAGLLLFSAVLLVEFGRRLWQGLDDGLSRHLAAWLRPAAYALPTLGVVALTAAANDPLVGFTAGVRYFFVLTGSLLTGSGFVVLHRQLSVGEGLRLCPVRFLPLAAAGFLAYALFGGVVVAGDPVLPSWLPTQAGLLAAAGIPAEVFRALCVLSVAVGVGALLRGINVESRRHERVAQEVLRASEGYFRGLFESANVGIAFTDAEGIQLRFNAAHEQLTGYAAAELQGMHFTQLIHAEDRSRIVALSRELRDGKRDHVRAEMRVVRKNGGISWLDMSVVKVVDRDSLHFITVLSDVTEHKQAESRLRLLARVFEHSGEAILITDADNCIITVNDAFTRLTGYAQEDAIGQNPSLLATGRTPPEVYTAMWQALAADGYWEGEIWDRRKDGSEYPKWLAISAVRDGSGELLNYIGRFNDITAQKRAEEQIRRLAHHDPLTGLPNRFTLRGRLDQALAAARREKRKVAIMFIDLDRFKTINDTCGHPVGDALLIEVAGRLQSCVRDSDVVARLGGDEFVIVLTGVETQMAVAGVGEKILRELGRPYRIENHDLHSTPSIGIALFPDDGDNVERLMQHADTAMYHAKSNGRNNYRYFTADMNVAAEERQRLEQEMHLALERNEFVLNYQPQIETGSGYVRSVEALVRWEHPQLGTLPPARFLPAAEESGFIVPLGEWVLDQACRQVREWRNDGLHVARVAVNVSAAQLRDHAFAGAILDTLTGHGLSGRDLELELSEAEAMENAESVAHVLESLRHMGVALVIDDFGTGYAPLRYMKLLPVQRIKLDRSFIKDIKIDQNDAAICAATRAIAQNLGLGLVAHGVECAAERDTLDGIGYNQFQGYLYCEPMSAAAARDFMRAQRRELRPN